mmetsp:Transcript_9907/g.21575  ORF Transcript_9907/g.21575 Transcript_9907/m.21575 type:complete len:269 (-) Transcript_9907:370-1176(-)
MPVVVTWNCRTFKRYCRKRGPDSGDLKQNKTKLLVVATMILRIPIRIRWTSFISKNNCCCSTCTPWRAFRPTNCPFVATRRCTGTSISNDSNDKSNNNKRLTNYDNSLRTNDNNHRLPNVVVIAWHLLPPPTTTMNMTMNMTMILMRRNYLPHETVALASPSSSANNNDKVRQWRMNQEGRTTMPRSDSDSNNCDANGSDAKPCDGERGPRRTKRKMPRRQKKTKKNTNFKRSRPRKRHERRRKRRRRMLMVKNETNSNQTTTMIRQE